MHDTLFANDDENEETSVQHEFYVEHDSQCFVKPGIHGHYK